MFSEPRNWKWMAPSTMMVLFIAIYGMVPATWGGWGYVPLGLAVICGVAAALNFWLYLDAHVAQSRIDLANARNATPEVRVAEAMRGMHPEAVRALMMRNRSIWRLRYIPAEDFGDWIYDESPILHAGFVEFVLDHSSAHRGELMKKEVLSQGSKQFDPNGIVSDYEQYDALIELLERKMMITRAMGNQPAKFLPPYTLDVIRHYFLLDDDGSVESDAKTATMKRAAELMASKAGIPALRPLVNMGAVMAEKPEPIHPTGLANVREPELKDDELQAIKDEEARYAKFWKER